MLNKGDINRYLEEINACMARDGITGEIIICGGAVMSLVYGTRESTKDIDALFAPADAIRAYASKIAREHGLPADWLNDGVKGFIDTSKMDFEPVLEMSNLAVRRPTDDEMLAMKLSSAREQSYDFADALYIMKRIGVADLDEVMDIMERYVSPNSLTPLAGFFAEEVYAQYQREMAADKAHDQTWGPSATIPEHCTIPGHAESLSESIARAVETSQALRQNRDDSASPPSQTR